MEAQSGGDGPVDRTRSCLRETAAIPTFGSPFRWRVVARLTDAYELYDIDILEARLRSRTPPPELLKDLSVRVPDQRNALTDEAARSRGYGSRLMARLKDEARAAGCSELQLISHVRREEAHRFYFREGLGIECFHFRAVLDDEVAAG